MTNEAENQSTRDEEYAKKLRAARIRGVVTLMLTVVALGSVYRCSVGNGGLPVASCKSDRDCAGDRADPICVSAPTGSYCSHGCDTDQDCSAGYVCNAPPWVQGKADRLCIHDSQHIGQ